ncbi:MAG TPA: hypothetical protein VKT27_03180 [Candidatus Binataceae bacterium]|nr:hypothetical protein [Candidatus Binataceae bacterium]
MIALATAAIAVQSIAARAQPEPASAAPDMRMLLNLDLFRPQSAPSAGAEQPESETGGSMVDQIRALRALGYLGGKHNKARSADGADSGATGTSTPSASPQGAAEQQP